jgi:hypothetical protein
MCNNVEEEFFFFSSSSSFLFRSSLILSDEASEAFDSFDRLHFLFLFSLCSKEGKKEPSDSDISTLREKEKYLSKKEKRKHLLLAPSDRCLAGATDSFSFSQFFSSVRSFMLLLYDVLTCVFFFSSSLFLSSVVFGAVSFSLLLTNAITTLLDDLVDYFLQN